MICTPRITRTRLQFARAFGRGELRAFNRYLVTGDREVTAALTVRADGSWALERGTLHDVTHLPCRSARYTSPQQSGGGVFSCSPARADASLFPVKPGAPMPAVPGCAQQDYAVLFVVGVEA
jgi:hypothetical protein